MLLTTFSHMLVLLSATGHRFHLPGCVTIEGSETHSVPLTERIPQRPCKVCFPDAPRPKLHRHRCEACGGRLRPCAHNGGVRVAYLRTYQTVAGPRTVTTSKMVWPENVRRYPEGSVA